MSQNKTIAKLQEMKQSKKGFTLVELLIVVAIIAILVAIAVPTFLGSVDKANTQTDQANVRTAKAVATQQYLMSGKTGGTTYYFDANSGICKDSNAGIAAYGKSNNAVEGATGTPKGNIIKVVVTDAQTSSGNVSTNSTVTLSWEEPATASTN